jgi:DNA-binding NtrC family response regulator
VIFAAALVVVVHADPLALRRIGEILTNEGLQVVTQSSFEEARELLHWVSPDLLVADVRLAAFNGLHLAALSRLEHPSRPVVITHAFHDPVLESEAVRLGATFIVNPLENEQFVLSVRSLLDLQECGQERVRRWARKQMVETVQAEAASVRARIVNVSYGGLQLLFERWLQLPPSFDVVIPTAGIEVKALRVWTDHPSAFGGCRCGAALAEAQVPDEWREFVDSSA